MIKIISAMVLLFWVSTSSNALELKLQCDITSKETYSSGNIENQHGSAQIEIYDYGVDKSIYITSEIMTVDSQNVATRKFSDEKVNVTSVTDFSDANKWDISNTVRHVDNGDLSEVHVMVDRNSGYLVLSSETTFGDGSAMFVNTSGNCKKINTKIKKF